MASQSTAKPSMVPISSDGERSVADTVDQADEAVSAGGKQPLEPAARSAAREGRCRQERQHKGAASPRHLRGVTERTTTPREIGSQGEARQTPRRSAVEHSLDRHRGERRREPGAGQRRRRRPHQLAGAEREVLFAMKPIAMPRHRRGAPPSVSRPAQRWNGIGQRRDDDRGEKRERPRVSKMGQDFGGAGSRPRRAGQRDRDRHRRGRRALAVAGRPPGPPVRTRQAPAGRGAGAA